MISTIIEIVDTENQFSNLYLFLGIEFVNNTLEI